MTVSIPAFVGEHLRTFGITATDWSGSDGNGTFQFRAVVRDAANQGNVLIASVPTTDIAGVLQNDPRANESCNIAFIGDVKVLLGGTVAYNDPLTIDANGRFLKAVAASGNVIYGRALMPGVLGDIISATVNVAATRLA